jgi:hypothetical protein
MKTYSFVSDCIIRFAANGYTYNDAEFNKREASVKLSQDGKGEWLSVIFSTDGEKLQGLVDAYNEAAGARVCNLGLIKRVHGGEWQVEDEWLSEPICPENAAAQYPADARCPMSWTIDNKDYELAIFLEGDYKESEVEDFTDLAEYLNACVERDGGDPNYYIRDWCEAHGCDYDPEGERFREEDFAFDEASNEVLTLNGDGMFAVRTIDED